MQAFGTIRQDGRHIEEAAGVVGALSAVPVSCVLQELYAVLAVGFLFECLASPGTKYQAHSIAQLGGPADNICSPVCQGTAAV